VVDAPANNGSLPQIRKPVTTAGAPQKDRPGSLMPTVPADPAGRPSPECSFLSFNPYTFSNRTGLIGF